MSTRPVFDEQIGRFFADLRAAKGWTQRQAGDISERRKIPMLTKNVLWRLETGKVKNVEPEVLRAVADLYEMPYERVAGAYLHARYGTRPSAIKPLAPAERTDDERRLLTVWRKLPADLRPHVMRIISYIAKHGVMPGAKEVRSA